jgi:hypothetical protein
LQSEEKWKKILLIKTMEGCVSYKLKQGYLWKDEKLQIEGKWRREDKHARGEGKKIEKRYGTGRGGEVKKGGMGGNEGRRGEARGGEEKCFKKRCFNGRPRPFIFGFGFFFWFFLLVFGFFFWFLVFSFGFWFFLLVFLSWTVCSGALFG